MDRIQENASMKSEDGNKQYQLYTVIDLVSLLQGDGGVRQGRTGATAAVRVRQ